jgi:hypothetical protein
MRESKKGPETQRADYPHAQRAIGAHARSAAKCYEDFKKLTGAILNRAAD